MRVGTCKVTVWLLIGIVDLGSVPSLSLFSSDLSPSLLLTLPLFSLAFLLSLSFSLTFLLSLFLSLSCSLSFFLTRSLSHTHTLILSLSHPPSLTGTCSMTMCSWRSASDRNLQAGWCLRWAPWRQIAGWPYLGGTSVQASQWGHYHSCYSNVSHSRLCWVLVNTNGPGKVLVWHILPSQIRAVLGMDAVDCWLVWKLA